jgi:hypothetical protein
MKFNIYAWAILALAIVSSSSCTKKLEGSGKIISVDRSVNVFSGIQNEGSFKVVLVNRPAYALTLHGEDNILPEIETSVTNGILRIRYRRTNVNPSHAEIIVTVAAPEINQLIVRGSGEIVSEDIWTSPSLFMNVGGSGTIRLNENSAHTKANVSGSGNILLRGKTITGSYIISGSGSIRAFDLVHDQAEGNISGSGRCEINVTQELQAVISGSGSVIYKGNPDVKSTISGSGKVTREF